MRNCTVWVGGTEVLDSYQDYTTARRKAEQYQEEGFDDVVIEKVFSKEIEICLELEKKERKFDIQTQLLTEAVALMRDFKKSLNCGILPHRRDKKYKISQIVGMGIVLIIDKQWKKDAGDDCYNDVINFLNSRSHWADVVIADSYTFQKEIIFQLEQVIANVAMIDKSRGMSVKPLLKLLGLKENL